MFDFEDYHFLRILVPILSCLRISNSLWWKNLKGLKIVSNYHQIISLNPWNHFGFKGQMTSEKIKPTKDAWNEIFCEGLGIVDKTFPMNSGYWS